MATSVYPSLFTDKLTPEKIAKVEEVAKAVKITYPVHLMAVMFFESGRTFSPSVTNGIGSVGLIQFTRDKKGVEYKTIAGKKYMLADLKKMTFMEQMDVVKAYYLEAGAKRTLSTFIDVYLVTFFPKALGQADSYLFQTSGLSASLIAQQNPAFDRNGDGKIYKGEVIEYFRKLYNSWGFKFDSEINVTSVAKSPPVIGIVVVFFYTCFTVFTCI